MTNVGVFAYAAAAAAFLFLTVLLIATWRRYHVGALFVVAAASSTAWAAMHAYNLSLYGPVPAAGVELAEVLRAAAWFACLLGVLGQPAAAGGNGVGVLRTLKRVAVSLPIVLLTLFFVVLTVPGVSEFPLAPDVLLVGHLLLAVFGLVLVEQLFRNSKGEQRWGVKFLCFGIGVLFAFDFYLHADALLLKRMDADLWNARGLVNALAVPLVVVAARRAPLWSGRLMVSRHVVFHGAALLGAGVYLMLMAGAGYYIRAYGGEWGVLLQVVFFLGALTMLAILALSGQMRARLRVFVAKHFFVSKYDYRDEWLRFAEALSVEDDEQDMRMRILQAIAEITDSPSGVLWVKAADVASYEAVAEWNVTVPGGTREALDGALARFLRQRQWVIDVNEHADDPQRYAGLALPAWLTAWAQARLVVPLMHHDDVLGFAVLGQPRATRDFNWEDHDLLKTAGRQAAGYLKLIETGEALFEARQFDAFHRLSAYVVHDLKNIAAQLSLVVANARKHMHNPEFVTDAVRTVDHAVAKMNRMLTQLRQAPDASGPDKVVDVAEMLREVVAERSSMQPVPTLSNRDRGVYTSADPDRLAAVVGHVIQNAQEATPASGEVVVRLHADDAWAVIEVEDSGCGMDEQFVRTRLFRPFDTTKGNAGMGVGAYEAREFVRAHGGDVQVVSRPGAGTTFRVRLPRHSDSGAGKDKAPLSAVQ